jgi:hypothetical protein
MYDLVYLPNLIHEKSLCTHFTSGSVPVRRLALLPDHGSVAARCVLNL